MSERPRPDPIIEAYKKDVDVTLLLENLRRTPQERVRAMLATLEFTRELRESMQRAKNAR